MSNDRAKRLELSSIRGVLVRELINYKSYWRSSAFSSIGEPIIYFLAFSFGLGAVIGEFSGHRYLDFIATGTVGMTVMYSGAFPGMFSTFVKYKFQHTYNALLAAPVDTEELVTAEALWLALRVSVYGCAPILIAFFFGLTPSWGMLMLPFICFISGMGWALFGIAIAATMNSIDNFNYVITIVLTPLMLVAGTFFPVSNLPHAAQLVAYINPLYNSVELVRAASFGWNGWGIDLTHVLVLVIWATICWRIAIRQMTKRLID